MGRDQAGLRLGSPDSQSSALGTAMHCILGPSPWSVPGTEEATSPCCMEHTLCCQLACTMHSFFHSVLQQMPKACAVRRALC